MPLPALSAEIRRRLARIDPALHLVRAGNGIHNWGYAIRLLDAARRTLRDLLGQLPPATQPAAARR